MITEVERRALERAIERSEHRACASELRRIAQGIMVVELSPFNGRHGIAIGARQTVSEILGSWGSRREAEGQAKKMIAFFEEAAKEHEGKS